MKFAVLILLIFIAGCDLVTTRDPEPPQLPRANYTPATTPEILIQNLINAFHDKIPENYISCFSEKKFQFSPSAGSAAQFQFLQSWTYQDERQNFNNIIHAVPGSAQIVLNLVNQQKNLYGDSVAFAAVYSLSVPFSDEQKPRYYQGNLHFTFIKDQNNQWVISNWLDIKDEKYPSWSELKGRIN